MRRLIAFESVIAVVLTVLVGCSSDRLPTPKPTLGPPLQPVALAGPKDGVRQGIMLETLALLYGPRPAPGLDDGGSEPLRAGRHVVLLGDPLPGPDGTWARAWVPYDPQFGPGDVYAWVPATQNGRATLGPADSAVCPAVATIVTIAPLLPPDRLRCVGRTPITIDARSWSPGEWSNYDVAPRWYGTNSDPGNTISLFDAGPEPMAQGAATNAEAAGAWIDARIPPNVDPPPRGLYLRVTGAFDDPSAAGCVRTTQGGAGLPTEAPADSIEWCRLQFVVSHWEALLGPEGRPIDLAAPQLHRFAIPNVQPGMALACGGVGMPPLTIRIDLSKVDPVWIQLPGGRTSIASFDRTFQIVLGDPPRVAGPNGVVLVDGEVLDPDRGKPGLGLCPEGDVVTFSTMPS